MKDITPKTKVRVQQFKDYVTGDASHKRFDEMIDETIYIIKLEPIGSDTYGPGYKVWFKDLPPAKETYTAACFGQYVVPQLEQLYHATHDGKTISLSSPVRTVIRKAGNTYHFE